MHGKDNEVKQNPRRRAQHLFMLIELKAQRAPVIRSSRTFGGHAAMEANLQERTRRSNAAAERALILNLIVGPRKTEVPFWGVRAERSGQANIVWSVLAALKSNCEQPEAMSEGHELDALPYNRLAA